MNQFFASRRRLDEKIMFNGKAVSPLEDRMLIMVMTTMNGDDDDDDVQIRISK